MDKLNEDLTNNLNERLDGLKKLIQEPDFLGGKGLSNEVNIRIFCYDPKDEMAVRHFVGKLKEDSSLVCNIVECDLYRIFLSICEDMGLFEGIEEMEEDGDPEYMLGQLGATIGERDFAARMSYSPHEPGDLLLITGVGDVYPFMRLHSLLETIQPSFEDMPILVMYPGTFSGHYLRLFDRLVPNDYYRAFNVI